MPSFQFYPADWLNNIKLQSCSLEAQGLLINLMCLMHQAKPYGYLLVNGSYPLNKTVARLLRLHSKTYDKTLIELISSGVLSTNEKGVIYCGRMVKDERIREVRREAGKLGGNPLLKQKVKQTVKQKTTPSSSSSSSSIDLKKTSKRKGVFQPPSLADVLNYFKEKGYSEAAGKKAYEYYNIAGWQDSRGNPVKNWKQKMIAVWFKEENLASATAGRAKLVKGSDIVEKWKKDAEGGN